MPSFEVNESLHESINNNRLDEVVMFLSRNHYDNFYYNSEMVSAAAAAIKAEHFDIYEYLISKGLRCGLHEHISEITKDFHTTRTKLRDIHKKHFKLLERSHLEVLISKCRIGHNADESMSLKYVRRIADAFSDLNDLAIIEPILKVLAQADISIVFDFDRNSVDHLDPTKNKLTLGATYFFNGLIYIGAKKLLEDDERLEVLATMAHEFSHYALNMVYNNFCSPYLPDDENTRLEFDSIVDSCKSNVDKEHLMKEVFHYSREKIHSELIVCVPQLTVFYKDDEISLLRCRFTYDKLFNFFEEKTLVDLDKEYPRLEAMRKVRELNGEFGILSELKPLSLQFKGNISSFTPSKYDDFTLMSSNCPQLTMASICRELCDIQHYESFYLFLNVSQFQNTFDSILDAHKLCIKPTIILDCGSRSFEETLKVHGKISLANLEGRIVLVTNEDTARSTLSININVIPTKHLWNDLNDELQNELMKRNVLFQGRGISFDDIIDLESIAKMGENLPLEKLLSQNILLLHQENKSSCIEFYIERRFFKNEKESEEELTTEKVIKFLREGNVIVLSAEPGMGKTTELKKIAKQLECTDQLSWISYVDLKTVEISSKKNQVLTFDDCAETVKFLSENVLKLEGFEGEVFKYLFTNDRVIFLIDGFDEINPYSRQLILDLVVAISKNSKNLLFVSTRPHLTEDLKAWLKPTIIGLKGFSENDRKNFIEKIISSSFQHTERETKLKKIESFFSKSAKSSFENPSLIRMIVEIMKDDSDFDKSVPNDFEVYDNFLTAIIERYMDKGADARKSAARYFGNAWFNEFYQKFAVKSFLSMNNEKLHSSISFPLENVQTSHKEHIYRAGIMYHEDHGDLKFVHSTFIEFFACKFIIDKIFCQSFQSDEELDFVINLFISVATIEFQSNMIVKFLNYALEPFVSQNNLLENDPNIEKLSSRFVAQLEKRHFLHKLIQHKGLNIIKLLTTRAGFNSIFDEKDFDGNNILFTAAGCLTVEDFEKLCTTISHYLGKDFLIANLCEKSNRRERLFLNALKNEDDRVLKFLFNSTKLNNIRLQGAFQDISNDFETIINCNNVENYEEFLEILRQSAPDNLKSFCRTVNMRRENIVHVLCTGPDLKKLESSFKFLENAFSNEELTEILCAQCCDGETSLMKASRNNNVKIIKTLLHFLDKLLTTENLKKILLMKNKTGLIALHFAVERDNEEIFFSLFDVCQKLFNYLDLKKILKNKFTLESLVISSLKNGKSIRTLLFLLGLMEQLYLPYELKEMLNVTSKRETIIGMINYIKSFEIKVELKTWFNDHLGLENEAEIIDQND